MKSGELAAKIREAHTIDVPPERSKEYLTALERAWDKTDHIVQHNLPLILAALDVAEWANQGVVHTEACAPSAPGSTTCSCGLRQLMKALRRAEEEA